MTRQRPFGMAVEDLERESGRSSIPERHKGGRRRGVGGQWLSAGFVQQQGEIAEFGAEIVDERSVLIAEEGREVSQGLIWVEQFSRKSMENLTMSKVNQRSRADSSRPTRSRCSDHADPAHH